MDLNGNEYSTFMLHECTAYWYMLSIQTFHPWNVSVFEGLLHSFLHFIFLLSLSPNNLLALYLNSFCQITLLIIPSTVSRCINKSYFAFCYFHRDRLITLMKMYIPAKNHLKVSSDSINSIKGFGLFRTLSCLHFLLPWCSVQWTWNSTSAVMPVQGYR